MAGPLVVSAGSISAAAGVPLLWIAWRRPPAGKRIPRAIAWLLIAGATVLLGFASGAWGIAVAAMATSAAALLVLTYVALTGVPAKRAATRMAPYRALDVDEILAELPRRLAVFVLVVPGGLLASSVLALGARAAAQRAGLAEADTSMLALAGMPLAWAVIASVQMTQSSVIARTLTLMVPALAGGILSILS